ncbi:hypothetical protein GCM10018781_15870 [Kitasatospora indigofera]|uniref:Uncharacterized protein n=1 Tax=Kitasatospora indigofera TaxID=67307 RepID=A0A919FH96_9ACTN|nr:DUF6099 family protein [Kitasatospora indigofera]GHH64560.1 hypothetical protein GCM10018781_15870 [Kitasatospora indigofera]
MDALRLIKTARHAMAEARDVPDVLLEAWQAGLLTEAVGSRLAERGDGEVAALGQLLSEAGAQVASCLEPSPESAAAADFGSSGRASRLTDLGDLDPLLEELARLLHDATETLVVLACGADAESLYWTCIDGVDAGSECKDLVAELHRAVRGLDSAGGEEPGAGARTGAEAGVEAEAGAGPGAWPGREPVPGGRTGTKSAGRAGDGERSGERTGERVGERSGERAGDRVPDPLDTVCSAAPGRTGACGRAPDRLREQAGSRAAARGGGGRAGGGTPGGAGPVLVVPLAPPSGARGYRPPADSGPSAGPAGSAAAGRVPEDCRAAPIPARSAFTEASSSCICSSRLLGVVAGAATAARPVALGSCGAAGASDQCSDMRGPLRIGGVL